MFVPVVVEFVSKYLTTLRQPIPLASQLLCLVWGCGFGLLSAFLGEGVLGLSGSNVPSLRHSSSSTVTSVMSIG